MKTLVLAVQTGEKAIDFMTFVMSIAGALIIRLITVIGFFLSRIVSDVRANSTNIGRNKGQIELVDQQRKNDTRRIEETTQLEIRIMSKNVGELSTNVQTLVTMLAERGIQRDNENKN